MTKTEKIELLENRLKNLQNNNKENVAIQNKLIRTLRNLKNS